jgi:hypothetical protein
MQGIEVHLHNIPVSTGMNAGRLGGTYMFTEEMFIHRMIAGEEWVHIRRARLYLGGVPFRQKLLLKSRCIVR